jgi:hypothetical protein
VFTSPSIEAAQNRPEARRRLAAQARLYSDVKRARAIRFAAAVIVGGVVAGLALSHHNSPIGAGLGIAALFGNGLLMYRERRRAELAAAIQEDFDCTVFQLPWNDIVTRRHPTGQQIASAAERYTGGRTHDWYPETAGLQRPLDILVCQQSNMGWGAPVHRAWAWVLVGSGAALAVVLAAVWSGASLDAKDGLNDLVAPFLATFSELFQNTRENFESARSKEDCHEQLLSDWDAALAGARLTDQRCRGFQDAIAHVRQQNAQVPDWFDRRLRTRNERAMRTTAADMISRAKRAGLA